MSRSLALCLDNDFTGFLNMIVLLLQVGKSYFELVDYQEAHRAFSLARLASPYSLEGMDIHSTVLYVSFLSFA